MGCGRAFFRVGQADLAPPNLQPTFLSGLQLIGAIGPFVKHMTIFMRTPSWILPHFASLTFTPDERKNFKDKNYFWKYYVNSWETAERFWSVYTDGSKMQERVVSMGKAKLEREVKDPVLRAKLTPNYPFGCRRLTPSLNFYDVVQMKHVDLVMGDVISHVVPEGVVTKDGTLHKCDTLVFATGGLFKGCLPSTWLVRGTDSL